MGIFCRGSVGKMVRIFENMLPKLSSANQNQQSFGNFRKCSKKGEKFKGSCTKNWGFGKKRKKDEKDERDEKLRKGRKRTRKDEQGRKRTKKMIKDEKGRGRMK